MNIYATTTSERASKGQGGNKYLNIELKDEYENIILSLHYQNDDKKMYLSCVKGEFWALSALNTHTRLALNELEQKGKSQKGEKLHIHPNTGSILKHCPTCGAE
jgi:hypothetical protein